MIKTAWRNLFRHKRRTILTFSILSFAIMYYIVMLGMLDGFEIESTKNFINLELGHLKIVSEDHNPETFEGRIANFPEIEKELREFNFIKGICPRLKLAGMIDNGIDEYPVIIVGIDPEKDKEVFKLYEYADEELTEDGIWIGTVIAKRFEVDTGDVVFLTFRGAEGQIVSKEFVIKGILDAPSFAVNNIHAFVHLKTLNEIGNFKGEITEISIKTDNFLKTFHYKSALEKKLSHLKITTWQEEGKDYLSISQGKRAAQYLLLVFIILIGIIGTTNTLMIAVYERLREIGTLKSLGMDDKEVMKLFLTEGFFIGLLGSIGGIILGVIINAYLVKYGINWTPLLPKEMNFGYRVSGVVKNAWNFSSIIVSMVLGPVSTLIASYFPAKKASKLTPAECLRWV